MNIILEKKIDQNFPLLSTWEKLFVQNYYKKALPTGKNKEEIVRDDIKKQLENIVKLSKDSLNFKIDTENNPHLERYFESEIKALKQRGDGEEADRFVDHKKVILNRLSSEISTNLYEEFKHIVDYILSTNFEDAFKVLMLTETLTKIYKKEENKTIVTKREINKNLEGHMVFNDLILENIDKHIVSYLNFANLYFDSVEIYKKQITSKSVVNIENVNTFGMGKWIKFEGKNSNPTDYLENAKQLSTLVKSTPWCTKTLATSQLSQGDFYVFVDNDNNPHIAVKMSGNYLDELRGIKGGNAQELEDEYRKIAIEFLEKNEEILDGIRWLKKEEWNLKLVDYIDKLKNDRIDEIDIKEFIENVFINDEDYKSHAGHTNSHLLEIRKNINKVIPLLSKYFNINEEEIYYEDPNYSGKYHFYKPSNENKIKMIIGDVYFTDDLDLEDLEIVVGDLSVEGKVKRKNNLKKLKYVFKDLIISEIPDNLTSEYEILNLQNLEKVGKDLYLNTVCVESLPSLKIIGNDAKFNGSNIKNLQSLEKIGGAAYFAQTTIENLDSLRYIGDSAYFSGAKIERLPKLEYIGGFAGFDEAHIKDLSNLYYVGGYASFYLSKIENLDNLHFTKGLNLAYSKITRLDSLQEVDGSLYLEGSAVKSMKNLEIVREDFDLCNSLIKDLSNIKKVNGKFTIDKFNVKGLYNIEKADNIIFITTEMSKIEDMNYNGKFKLTIEELKELSRKYNLLHGEKVL